jgi:hypothetical protein
MFKNKTMKPKNKQVVVEPKVSNPLVHMLDVNMATTKNKLLKNMYLRIESLLLIGKRNKNYNNLLSRLYRRCKYKYPPQNLISKEKHTGVKVGHDC